MKRKFSWRAERLEEGLDYSLLNPTSCCPCHKGCRFFLDGCQSVQRMFSCKKYMKWESINGFRDRRRKRGLELISI